jgi:hypothetical protein
MKSPVEYLKDWYNVKTTHGLWLNLLKDIVFFSLFFYIGFNSNQYCVKQGLLTVNQYKQLQLNHTLLNQTFNISDFNLTLVKK